MSRAEWHNAMLLLSVIFDIQAGRREGGGTTRPARLITRGLDAGLGDQARVNRGVTGLGVLGLRLALHTRTHNVPQCSDASPDYSLYKSRVTRKTSVTEIKCSRCSTVCCANHISWRSAVDSVM